MSRRPDTKTIREFVLELAAERLPTDGRDLKPGDAAAALEELSELELWQFARRWFAAVQAARRLVGGKPGNGHNEPDTTRRL